MIMEDELSLSLDGKTLGNLRVVDLKQELEKRGLSKSGSKKKLIKRLKQQLEFEKLCEENKSSGDCELKKELDAATEQNEFVQRYLAQQQKIFAEQKEMKRLIELEEIQKKSELKECPASPETSGNQSSDESESEQVAEVRESENDFAESAIKNKSDCYDKITLKEDLEKDVSFTKKENIKNLKAVETLSDTILKQDIISDTEKLLVKKTINQADKNLNLEKTIYDCKDSPKKEVDLKSCILEKDSHANETISKIEIEKCVHAPDKSVHKEVKSKISSSCEEDLKSDDTKNKIDSLTVTESENETTFKFLSKNGDKNKDGALEKVLNLTKDKIIPNEVESSKNIEDSELIQTKHPPKKENETGLVDCKNQLYIPASRSLDLIDPEEEQFTSIVGEISDTSSNMKETTTVSLSSPHHQNIIANIENNLLKNQKFGGSSEVSSSKESITDLSSADKPLIMDSNVPYSLSDIKLPDSPSSLVKNSNKSKCQKDDKNIEPSDEESQSDNEVQANGVSSILKSSEKQSKRKVSRSKSITEELSIKDAKPDSQTSFDKEIIEESLNDNLSDSVNSKNKCESRSPCYKKSLNERNLSDSEDNKISSKKDNLKYSNRFSSSSKSEESSSEESSSEEENRKRRSRIVSTKFSKKKKSRTPSSSRSPSSKSRESSLDKDSDKNLNSKNKSIISEATKITVVSSNEKSSNKISTADKNKPVSNDPPRKKLKINRNNIILPEKKAESRSEKIKSSKISKTKSDCRSPEKIIESVKISTPSSKKISSEKTTEEKYKDPSSPLQLSSEANEPEMGEIIENSPEMKYEPRKLKFPGRKLNRKSSEEPTSTEPKAKKSKWGKYASSQKSSLTISISTDSLKNWFPEFKLVNESTNITESMTENSPPITDEKKLSFTINTENETEKKSVTSNVLENNKEQTLEITESSGPVSKIVFIQNLVRPFTLLQLKELLKQSGCFIEEEFWIDKIKSKCFAMYETEEDAIKTRNALNGTRWPSSNPKILLAEFSTVEELELHRSGADVPKQITESIANVKESLDTKSSPLLSERRKRERDSEKRRERDRYRQQLPVREWDKDKISQDSPDRENIGKESEGLRTIEKKDKKESKKRLNEDTPAKLLDDLFQKTKSAPCIYWLPLTEVQVVEREEAKKLRRLEREKRIQLRDQEESEHKNKRPRADHKSKETESRRSSTRSRSPITRRR